MNLRSLIRTSSRIAVSALAAYLIAIRPWHLKWGTSGDEAQQPLPGDELVPDPKINATHAITIRGRAADVWPWLAQLGQGRGGFYSYDWLENLMRLDIHSAGRIIPELQDLKVGDLIPLAPGGFGIPVAVVEPGRALVLHGDTRLQPGAIPSLKPGDYVNTTWAFFLAERPDGTTRLIERFRSDYHPSLANDFFYRVFVEPGSFLMERKMLLGIRERVERSAE